MPRLPIVGSDDGTWGDILNEFLEVSLDNSSDPTGGTLKSSAVDDAGAVMNTDSSTAAMQFVVDEDNMASDSATKVPTQQSVKAYVDSEVGDVSTELDNTVKLTGNQTVSGDKTFTDVIRGDYGANGKIAFSGAPGVGGSIALWNDASDGDDDIGLGLSPSLGILMGNGSAVPDTVISRAGANNLSFNTARLSNVADPTDAQDAVTKHYMDMQASMSGLAGGTALKHPSLVGWYAKLENALNVPVNIVVISDSLGVLGSNALPNWPWNLRSTMTKRAGIPSGGVTGVFTSTGLIPRVTSADGADSTTGLAGYARSLSNGQKITHTFTGDGFSVLYGTNPGFGSLEIRDGVGGTLLATVTTTGAAKSSNIWTSGALSSGSRTIEITSVGNNIMEFIQPYNGDRTAGVRVWPATRIGATSSNFNGTASWGLDLIDALEAGPGVDLVIIATGANDTENTYPSEANTLRATVGGHTSAPVVMWLPYISNAFSQNEYNAGKAALTSSGQPFIDTQLFTGRVPTGDGTHQLEPMRIVFAAAVYAAIGGDPIGQAAYDVANFLTSYNPNPSTQTWQQGSGKVEIGTVFGSPTFNVFDQNPNSSFSIINHTLGSLIVGTGSSAISFGNGTDPSDVYMNRAGPARMAINQSQGTLAANLSPNINLQLGTSYTLVLTDAGKQIIRSNSSASTQTLPQNSDAAIPVGTIIPIINGNTGVVTFQAGTGATIAGDTTLAANQRATMTKVDTNIWFISTGGSAGTVTLTGTETLTNKRITPRVGTVTSSATPTINTDNVDYFEITAQTTDITSMTTNLSGTPTNGQKLWISITGTASRAITWGASFEASTVALPTTTSGTTRLDVGFIWNSATSKWRCVGAV